MPAISSYQKFYTDARASAVKLVEALEELQSHRAIWDADVYGNILPIGAGNNEGLTKDDIGPALFATVDAITGLNPAYLANLRKLK